MPCLFEGCPHYLSKVNKPSRVDPSEKKYMREQENLTKAIKESIEEKEVYDSIRTS